jgi:hypothetical protein
MFRRITDTLRRRRPHHAADLKVRATLVCLDGSLSVQIHSGQRVLLDEDGREIATEAMFRSELAVPFTELQRDALAQPMFASAMRNLHGKTVAGRLYLCDERVEYLELESADGSSLTWSARPGWCELYE